MCVSVQNAVVTEIVVEILMVQYFQIFPIIFFSQVRLPYRHAAKRFPQYLCCWGIFTKSVCTFLTKLPRMQKVFTFSRWPLEADLKFKNDRIICQRLDIMIFSSVLRGHFSNVNILLASMAIGSKSTYRFLKDGLEAEILRQTCKGVGFCFILHHTYKVTLIFCMVTYLTSRGRQVLSKL